MSNSSVAPPRAIKWDEMRHFARLRFRAVLRMCDEETIQDLVSDAITRLFRLQRQEEIRNPEALMTTLVHRLTVDYVRRFRSRGSRLEPLESVDGVEIPLPTADDPAALPADMLELFRFVVLEYFRENEISCHSLASEFFAEVNWSKVAERMQVKHNTVIKRWSRCVEKIRLLIETQSGPLWDWARAAQVV